MILIRIFRNIYLCDEAVYWEKIHNVEALFSACGFVFLNPLMPVGNYSYQQMLNTPFGVNGFIQVVHIGVTNIFIYISATFLLNVGPF